MRRRTGVGNVGTQKLTPGLMNKAVTKEHGAIRSGPTVVNNTLSSGKRSEVTMVTNSHITSMQGMSDVKGILKSQKTPKQIRGVVFRDEEQVIGYGGFDSSPEEGGEGEWDMNEEDFDERVLDTLDATEQDKMFTKLTRKNTDFNSINANLLNEKNSAILAAAAAAAKKFTRNLNILGSDSKATTPTGNTPNRIENTVDMPKLDLDLAANMTQELDNRFGMMKIQNAKSLYDSKLDPEAPYSEDPEDVTRRVLLGENRVDSIDSGAPSSRESSSSPDSMSLKGSERGSASPDSTRSSKSSAYDSMYDTMDTNRSSPQASSISTAAHVSTVILNNGQEVTSVSVGLQGRQPVQRASHRLVLQTESKPVLPSSAATTIQVQVRSGPEKEKLAREEETLLIPSSSSRGFALGPSTPLQACGSESNLLREKKNQNLLAKIPAFNAPIKRSAVSELNLDKVAKSSAKNQLSHKQQVKCLSFASLDQSYGYAEHRSAEKYGTLRRVSRCYEDPKYLAFTAKSKPVQPPVVPPDSYKKDIYGTYRAAKKYTAPKIPPELELEPIYAEPIEQGKPSAVEPMEINSNKQSENIYQEIRGSSATSRKERQLAELAVELEKARYNSVPNRRSGSTFSEYSDHWDPVTKQFRGSTTSANKVSRAPAIPRTASTGGSISRAGLFNLKKLLKRGNGKQDEEKDKKTWKAELQISQQRPTQIRPEILHPSDLERLGDSVIYQTPRMNSSKLERFGSVLHGTSEAQFQPLTDLKMTPPPPPLRQRSLGESDISKELPTSCSDNGSRTLQPKIPKRKLKLDYANMGRTTRNLQPLAPNLWCDSEKLLQSLQEINHQELISLLSHVSTCSFGLPVLENSDLTQSARSLRASIQDSKLSWSDFMITSDRVSKGNSIATCKAVHIPTKIKVTLIFTPPKALPSRDFLLERTVVASNGLQTGHTVLILPQSQIRTLREFSEHCDERSALYLMLQLCKDLQSLQAQDVTSFIAEEQQIFVASWDQLAYLLLMYKKAPKTASIPQTPLNRYALLILSELRLAVQLNPIVGLMSELLERNDFETCKRVIEYELWQAPRDPLIGSTGEVGPVTTQTMLERWLSLQKALAIQANSCIQQRHCSHGRSCQMEQTLPCSVYLEYQLEFLTSANAENLASTLNVIRAFRSSLVPEKDEELYADFRTDC